MLPSCEVDAVKEWVPEEVVTPGSSGRPRWLGIIAVRPDLSSMCDGGWGRSVVKRMSRIRCVQEVKRMCSERCRWPRRDHRKVLIDIHMILGITEKVASVQQQTEASTEATLCRMYISQVRCSKGCAIFWKFWPAQPEER
nr:uncharacterized protein LOC127313581 isoform X2 [Lolium perenne]